MKKLIFCLVAMTMLLATGCKKSYTVTVSSNNDNYGTVTGSGTYKEGESATITATAKDGCKFVAWQDDVTERVRTFEVTSDMNFIATFKVKEVNPAEEFAGTYDVSAVAHATLPIVGEIDIPINDNEAVITLNGDEGDVSITVGTISTAGHVSSSGMNVDPVSVPLTYGAITVQLNASFPLISKPVDGVTTFTAQLSGTYAGQTIAGTADITATKRTK